MITISTAHRRAGLRARALVAMAALGVLGAACSSSGSGSTGSTSPSTGASGGSSSSAPSSGQPFVVGATLPLSGTFAAIGHDALVGLKAAAAKINSDGGILGRQVKLISKDNAGDPTKAALAAQQLVSDDHPDFILPGATSVDTAGPLPVTSRARIITIAAPGSPPFNDPKKNPYHFQFIEPDTSQIAAMVPAVKSFAPTAKSVGILAATDPSESAYVSYMTKDFPAAGYTIAGKQTYDPGATDVTVQLQKLRDAGAQVLIVHAIGPAFDPVLKGVESLHWGVKIVGDESTAAGVLTGIVPSSVAAQYVGVAPDYLARTGNQPPAAAAVFAPFGGLQASLEVAYIAYDALMMDRWAVTTAGTTDADKVKAALESLRGGTSAQPTGLLGYPNPKYSPTDHSLSHMDASHFWALLTVSKSIDGTLIGHPLDTHS
jgi:branched-chain amino acid transport system substrate-binding protein